MDSARNISAGQRSGLTGRDILIRFFVRTLVCSILLLVICYLVDFVVLRYRIAFNHNPFGTVTVRPYYAVPQKNHRLEFLFQDPTDETCVHSLFPHMGDKPCWYLNSHKDERIDL